MLLHCQLKKEEKWTLHHCQCLWRHNNVKIYLKWVGKHWKHEGISRLTELVHSLPADWKKKIFLVAEAEGTGRWWLCRKYCHTKIACGWKQVAPALFAQKASSDTWKWSMRRPAHISAFYQHRVKEHLMPPWEPLVKHSAKSNHWVPPSARRLRQPVRWHDNRVLICWP